MMEIKSNLRSVTDAAKVLGVSESYVRRLLRDGKITGKRVNKRGAWLIELSEIARLLKDREGV